jgi:hypothetical protein
MQAFFISQNFAEPNSKKGKGFMVLWAGHSVGNRHSIPCRCVESWQFQLKHTVHSFGPCNFISRNLYYIYIPTHVEWCMYKDIYHSIVWNSKKRGHDPCVLNTVFPDNPIPPVPCSSHLKRRKPLDRTRYITT